MSYYNILSYSIEEEKWIREEDLNNFRATHSMIKGGPNLFVFGGSGLDESTGEVYSIKDNKWGVFSWTVDLEPSSPVVIR